MGRPREVAFLVLCLFTIGISKFSTTEDCKHLNPDDKDNDYTGGCTGGLYHGYGNLSYPDGGVYSGEWENGERNGNGTLEFPEDDTKGRKTFLGEWKNDVINGFGKMIWQKENPNNETSYVGHFENGIQHGFGTVVWQTGDTYTGDLIYDIITGNGTFRSDNGYSYTGEFKEGKFSGYGKQNWDNGDSYMGDYYEHKQTGNGTYYWNNGYSYTGEFYEGKLTGYGKYTFSDGTIYEGKFSEGVFNGTGIMTWKDGESYNGDFLDGQRTGTGTINWKSGSSYVGDFIDGKITGNGIYNYSSGIRYEGHVLNGDAHGNGTKSLKNGDTYIGEFKDDNYDGYGTYNFSGGDFYTGQWIKGEQKGNGTYIWKNGNVYTGQWVDGERTGFGLFNRPDGDAYAGDFKDNKFDGYGTYTYNNGNLYNGSWKNYEKHGNGTFNSKNGTTYDGVWEEGKLISVSKLEYFHNKSNLNSTNNCVTVKKAPNNGSVSIPWYIKSEDNTDMGVWNVWSKGITGKGVVVSVVDDGVSRCHPSIFANFDMKASYDFTDEDDDPSPESSDDWLGTKGASIIAARRNEPMCTIGVAYRASIGGIRMLQDPVTDLKEAKSLSFGKEYIDIFTISWGPDDDGITFDGPGPLTRHVLTDGANRGRNGLGSIFVIASGTGGSKEDDCNADGYATSIYTMAISSVDKNNTRQRFSERCSAIIATAYSGDGWIGTGLAASAISVDSCSLHDGTSASASIGTGIVALMLESNPSLSWRDVQHITVLSAQSDRLLHADTWVENGAGLMVSHSFGFGVMNAEQMVENAQHWVPVDDQKVCKTQAILEVDREIKVFVNCSEVGKLEHVQLDVQINAEDVRRGDIAITLSSPSGTKSIMMSERRNDGSVQGFDTKHWPLMSTHFWGEDPNGNWSITLSVGGNPFKDFDAEFTVNCFGTSDV